MSFLFNGVLPYIGSIEYNSTTASLSGLPMGVLTVSRRGMTTDLVWSSTNALSASIQAIDTVPLSGTITLQVNPTVRFVLNLANAYGATRVIEQSSSPTATLTSSRVNIINNGSFESATGWFFYTNVTSATFSLAPPAVLGFNSAQVSIGPTLGTNVQLYQYIIPLRASTPYRLEFYAKSYMPDRMGVNLQKHITPYSNYGINQVISTGLDWQTYIFNFTSMNTLDVTDGRLRFYFYGLSTPNNKFFIDGVSLIRV